MKRKITLLSIAEDSDPSILPIDTLPWEDKNNQKKSKQRPQLVDNQQKLYKLYLVQMKSFQDQIEDIGIHTYHHKYVQT